MVNYRTITASTFGINTSFILKTMAFHCKLTGKLPIRSAELIRRTCYLLENLPKEVLLQALNIAPGDGQILFNMAQALMGQNRFLDAEAVYRESIEHEFFTPMLFAGLCDSLREQGKISDAIEYFKKAYDENECRDP